MSSKQLPVATGGDPGMGDIRVVMSGAGAAGTAILKLPLAAGVKNAVVADIHGVVHADREDLKDADKGVPLSQSQAMHAALDKVGVENKLTIFPGADHDFYVKGDPAKTDAYATEAMAAMVGWFESHLRKSSPGR